MQEIEDRRLDKAQLCQIRKELEESFKEGLMSLGNHTYTKHLYKDETEKFNCEYQIDKVIGHLDDLIKDIAEIEIQMKQYEHDTLERPKNMLLN